MSSAALAPKPQVTEPISHPYHDTIHGLHARQDNLAAEITVIAGGLSKRQHQPLHAQTVQELPLPPLQRASLTQLHQRAQGVAYNLTKRERTFALYAGMLFAAISFAVVLF